MDRDGLFEDLPEVYKPERPLSGQGEARVLRPERRQIAMRAVDLDGFLPADHRARLVWAWVEAQDISELYAAIKARGRVAGRAAIDPAILLALWLCVDRRGGFGASDQAADGARSGLYVAGGRCRGEPSRPVRLPCRP